MGKKSSSSEKVAEKPMAEASGDNEVAYETRLKACSELAHPMASKKLSKRVLKTVRKAAKAKSVRRGVKEVVKGLRKGAKGVVVIAGDISPMDVISHIPVLCEDAGVPYIYVPSKEELGTAGSTKRPTSCILIATKKKDQDFGDSYDEVVAEVTALNKKLITTV